MALHIPWGYAKGALSLFVYASCLPGNEADSRIDAIGLPIHPRMRSHASHISLCASLAQLVEVSVNFGCKAIVSTAMLSVSNAGLASVFDLPAQFLLRG
ncbi:hypothetical protein AB4144_22540 [Rhizobiaceae sp. 2RAB30]